MQGGWQREDSGDPSRDPEWDDRAGSSVFITVSDNAVPLRRCAEGCLV